MGKVVLRPITADCKEYIQEGIKKMSERSRYLRFCRNMDELSPYELVHRMMVVMMVMIRNTSQMLILRIISLLVLR